MTIGIFHELILLGFNSSGHLPDSHELYVMAC